MQIKIKEFSGPLDLLLQLVRREEMDIFDIDIHKITDQYLYVLATHPIPDLNTAGDFIKMAATLIYIKSRSLFPPSEGEVPLEGESVEDPRHTLIQNLLPVQVLQGVAARMGQRSLLGRDVWTRGLYQDPELSPKEGVFNKNLLFRLCQAYRRVGHRCRVKQSFRTQPLPMISDGLNFLSPYLVEGSCFRVSSLMSQKKGAGEGRAWVLVTFLSLLELARQEVVSLDQDPAGADISVSVKKGPERLRPGVALSLEKSFTYYSSGETPVAGGA